MRSGTTGATAVDNVVYQHIEVASMLWSQRRILLQAPHVRLLNLRRLDARLEAHLDGMAISAETAARFCAGMLEESSSSALFLNAIHALETGCIPLMPLFSIAKADSPCRAGLLSAFGWLELVHVREWIARMLNSREWFAKYVGAAVCGMHRVDPGLTSARRFEDESPLVRARSWRTAGEIGKCELVSAAAAAIADEDPACQFWAAWAAVLLGHRHGALDFIASVAEAPGPFRARAFQLTLQGKSVQSAHDWLATFANEEANLRWLIRGAGLVGDPRYVPWLIGHMANLKTTRLAGEAFSLITGLDLAWLDLEVKPPENFETGPNDDPNDPNVDMDEDDGLPWPDVVKIQAWWQANSHRFQNGSRYLMGQPLNRENCVRVLKEGFQRQRIVAALHLPLLNPGTPLFEWRAPAWRQQRLLAEMS